MTARQWMNDESYGQQEEDKDDQSIQRYDQHNKETSDGRSWYKGKKK